MNKIKQTNFIDPIPKDWISDNSKTYTNFFHYIIAIVTYEDGSTQEVFFTKEKYQEHILLESLKKHIKDKKIVKEIIKRFDMFKTAYYARIIAEVNTDDSW